LHAKAEKKDAAYGRDLQFDGVELDSEDGDQDDAADSDPEGDAEGNQSDASESDQEGQD
jgi:hypothetical protein